jgi:NAD(P)-dependent dehydrogenase (short-subunit alcohol dehydrogenase family)
MTVAIFSGKVALVTGGASGIGRATARLLAQRGAAVVVADIDTDGALAVATGIAAEGGKALALTSDVVDAAQCDAAVATAVDAFGGLDILVNNAGAGRRGDSDAVTDDDWRFVLGLNLDGCFFMARAAIRAMLGGRGGAIVNTASMFGLVGFPGHAAYSAAKGGIVNLTRTLALEYAARGIRVNAVCPGVIRTALVKDNSADRMAMLESLHPMRRLGEAEEVARAICFLASDEASFVTGAMLAVDGGYTAG